MLSLHEWITLTASELREANADPAERLNRTGHATPLNETWARSVGLWCRAEARDLQGPGGPLEHVNQRAFETYKFRHRLKTGSKFRSLEGKEDWRLPELIASLYANLHQRRAGLISLGEPAAAIGKKVGVLPIEAVIWASLFQDVLNHHKIDLKKWKELSDDQKTELWDQGDASGEPWDVTSVYTRRGS